MATVDLTSEVLIVKAQVRAALSLIRQSADYQQNDDLLDAGFMLDDVEKKINELYVLVDRQIYTEESEVQHA